jgi:DNA-directed RNA polymerase subunit M/transcription elongation factor TFIIS
MTVACATSPLWESQTLTAQATLVRRMERNCFEETIESCRRDGVNRLFTEPRFVQRYSMIAARVIANLDTSGSVSAAGASTLLERILSGEVDAYNVATMTSVELNPAPSESTRSEITARQNQKFVPKYLRTHTCRKCNKNETTKIEFQSRAADEGSTHSIKCIHCGNIWRI